MTKPLTIEERRDEPPTCLRCDLTLTTREHEDGGRWKEFCHPCREILKAKWPVEFR